MNIVSRSFLVVGVLLSGAVSSANATPPTEKDKRRVALVAERLLAKMKRVPGYDVWPPDIRVVDADKEPKGLQLNAYAYAERKAGKRTPQIRITTLLLKAVVGDNIHSLALILGHELGHIHHGHVVMRTPGDTDFLKAVVNQDQEFEADDFGAKLMKEAGFSVVQGALGTSRFKKFSLHSAPLDRLTSSHPAWDDRFARVVQNPKVWELLGTFGNGVSLLSAEQFFNAEICFLEVTRRDPACYEAWVNLGYARLMQYCDKLDPKDLKEMGIGQVVCGAFYRRAGSLITVRGKDKKLWQEARAALNEALRLNPNLTLARANLGLAYLVHPAGKDLELATEYFEDALLDLEEDDTLSPFEQAALLVNLGAVHISGGNRKEGLKQLAQARTVLKKVDTSSQTEMSLAIDYNNALALASGSDRDEKALAIKTLEGYLRESDPFSPWWELGYDRYSALSKQLEREPQGKESLAKKFNTQVRRQLGIQLGEGINLTLGDKTTDVLERLGKPSGEVKVIGNLKRYRFDKFGVEVLASDRVLAIVLRSEKAPKLVLKTRGLGASKAIELRVGMSRKDLMETLPGARQTVGRYLLQKDYDYMYSYYRHLGLAVRYDGDYPAGDVAELILVQIPEPRGKGS